ncbi:MAG: ABC transporter permease [Blastocatellia bacterium]|nr:ABC transporter permease [Blastocatellia bacterium]
MRTLWQDLRYGARMLMKRPGFTLVATMTLALGIGANTAIFTVVNAVLLRPLPYPDSDRLVRMWETDARSHQEKNTASFPCLSDWRERSQSFEQIAAYEHESFILTGGREPERVLGLNVSANFFESFGVKPALGRDFLEEEDRYGGPRVVILSHDLWQRRFAGDRQAIGQTMTINSETYTLVGVLPQGVEYPDPRIEMWAPLALAPRRLEERGGHFLNVIGRLKAGVSTAAAQAEMNAVARRMEEQYPDNNTGVGALIMPLRDQMVGDMRLALWTLMGAVGFVLLIACANVATLLLAQSAGRRKELAIRSALGAGRRRLMRQLMTETALLACLGGGAGLLLAYWLIDLLAPMIPLNAHSVKSMGLDSSTLVFTTSVSLATGMIFGMMPALRASKTDLNESLRDGGCGPGGGLRHRRLRDTFVVTEMALALALLVGGGLLINSFWRLRQIKPGFDPQHVLTLQLNLPKTRYAGAEQQNAFITRVLERLAALPGVTVAGVTTELPFTGSRTSGSFEIEGRAPLPRGQDRRADNRAVSIDYFKTMGIPLLRGRSFVAQDGAGSPRVAIINEQAARRFFPGEDPISKRLILRGTDKFEIIGMVGDVKHMNLTEETHPELYLYTSQVPLRTWMDVAVRTQGDPESLISVVRDAIRGVDPDQPVYSVRTMEQRLAGSIAANRFNALLLGLFAAMAVILAATGIYGVMSYTVMQRTHEIGIRMALGAQHGSVMTLIIRQGMTVILIGIGIGVIIAAALARLMRGLLYGVGAGDPLTYVFVIVLLSGVALLACYFPARRATRVDPMIAIRQ